MMMKVKPFSYHIPPRRKSDDISTTNLFSATKKSTPFSVAASYFSPSCSSDNNRRRRQRNSSSIISLHCASSNLLFYGDVGSVLILVLLGFIGVAGQGKLSEMHDSSDGTLPTLPDTRLSHRSLGSFPGIDVLHNDEGRDNDYDDVLQQRISSMGQFGVKYRNSSYNYNYSSFPPHQHHDYYHRSRQYKLEPNFGTGITSSPRENLMLSLHEDVHYDQSTSSKNNSDIDENSINFQSIPKFQRNHIDNAIREEDDKAILNYADKQSYPIIREPQTPNHTSSITRSHQDQFTKTKLHYRSSSRRPGKQRSEEEDQYDVIDVDDYTNKEKARRQEKPPSFRQPFSQRETGERYPTSELDEYDDEDVIERFIPGNNSHTSGKLRFKQSSQAEVDGIENDDNSLRSRRRPRRSVVHLYDMVVCSTGCNPLIFKGYGCYCGFLGSGLTVDGIDKCCAKHDWCYHHAKCPPLLTYFVPYYWRCDHGRPQCVTDFRGWKGICGAHLCECDRQFAECLKKFPCPRSRAMCVTSPWSHTPADPRALPFTVSTPPRPWRPPPPLPFPPPPRIPFLPFPPMGRLFP